MNDSIRLADNPAGAVEETDRHPIIFRDLPPEISTPERAAAVLLPVPYDGTVAWQKGTALGPTALLEAAHYVELWDIETSTIPWQRGLTTLSPIDVQCDPRELADRVESAIGEILDRDQMPVMLGGEHSVTIGAVRAAAKRYPNMSVLQIDAHADTRESYHGSAYNHACVMARVREHCPIVQVGIRSLDTTELHALDDERVFWARDIVGSPDRSWIDRAVDLLATSSEEEHVYVTIDVDGFDPSILPATGTPEPGGLDWYQVNDLLAAVATRCKVVAFDVVELMPGHPPSAFTAAKLTYRFLAEILARQADSDR